MAVKHTFIWYKGDGGEIVNVTEELTPLQAIRKFCAHCNGFEDWRKKTRECPSKTCALWPFRMGRDESRKRELTEEQRKEIAERLKKSREE